MAFSSDPALLSCLNRCSALCNAGVAFMLMTYCFPRTSRPRSSADTNISRYGAALVSSWQFFQNFLFMEFPFLRAATIASPCAWSML